MAINVWIPIAECLAVLAVTFLLIRKYADLERTNWFSLTITGLSWFLAFSMICFIPLDIYAVSLMQNILPSLTYLRVFCLNQTSTTEETNNFLVFWWYFYYWMSFTLSVFVLPILVGYLEAADFTTRGRLCYALKRNLPYYAIYVVLFIVFVCFLYLSSVGRRIVEEGGGLVGVLMGINMTIGLC